MLNKFTPRWGDKKQKHVEKQKKQFLICGEEHTYKTCNYVQFSQSTVAVLITAVSSSEAWFEREPCLHRLHQSLVWRMASLASSKVHNQCKNQATWLQIYTYS